MESALGVHPHLCPQDKRLTLDLREQKNKWKGKSVLNCLYKDIVLPGRQFKQPRRDLDLGKDQKTFEIPAVEIPQPKLIFLVPIVLISTREEKVDLNLLGQQLKKSDDIVRTYIRDKSYLSLHILPDPDLK
jgi:hypothetical protein